MGDVAPLLPPESARKSIRVLIVDDSDADIALTIGHLRRVTDTVYDVESTNDSARALDMLLRHNHDVCLLDYRLGNQDGVEVLKDCQSASCTVPIILCTGIEDPTVDTPASAFGAADFIPKDQFDPDLLERSIRFAVEQARTREILRATNIELEHRLDQVNEAHHRLRTQFGELARMTKELSDARDSAEQAAVAKSRFLATMSHEIRTPMNGIIGAADLLCQSTLTGDQQELTDIICDSARALVAVLNDVLNFAKLEAGCVELQSEVFSLSDVVDGVLDLFKTSRRSPDIVMCCSIADDVPRRLEADPFRLKQVLMNLVGNATKFTEQGRIDVRVSTVRRTAETVRLRFQVSDTGIGIPADSLPALFDPFTQADMSTTRTHGGTGLGLAICSELVKLMGGEIDVDSCPGRGSSFWFEIDAGIVPNRSVNAADGTQPCAPALPQPARPPLRVLLAEDNYPNQAVTQAMLLRAGFLVEVVANGEEAAAAVVAGSYDVVLMDIHMPKLDGLAATRRIRALADGKADIPIIALTANAMPGDREEYLAGGMNGYVAKPVDAEQLIEAIRCCTDNRDPSISNA